MYNSAQKQGILNNNNNNHKVMVNGGGVGGAAVKASVAMDQQMYPPQKAAQHQFRKYPPPHQQMQHQQQIQTPTATMTNGTLPLRMENVAVKHQQQHPPKVVNSATGVISTGGNSHIPTVSANGIPGAAETTVTNVRTTAPASTVASDNTLDLSTGMLGKEKTAMCLVNELSRFNKVSEKKSPFDNSN